MNLVLSIAIIHLLACLSPGPDIFLVVRTSLRNGWQIASATTAGILTGVSLQIGFGLTGITYLISQNESLTTAIALCGSAWLIYLGIKGLRTYSTDFGTYEDGSGETGKQLSLQTAWMEGLLVNLLNPKALLFFLSLFSVLLGPDVPTNTRVACGLTMILVQAIAFTLVAILVSQPFFNSRWPALQKWLDRGISLILFGLGFWIWIKILLSLMA